MSIPKSFSTQFGRRAADREQLLSIRLPLVYHEDYSPPFPAGHRFPMEKFRLLHEHLSASGVLGADNWHRPELCPDELLALAHAPDYIRAFQAGELAPPLQRQLGLPWSEALARRHGILHHTATQVWQELGLN